MSYSALAPRRRRSKLSIAFTATVRVLFTTLLFTAAGWVLNLFTQQTQMIVTSL